MIKIDRKNPLFHQWIILGVVLLFFGCGIAMNSYNEYIHTGSTEQERLLTQTRVIQENLVWNIDALNKALITLQHDSTLLSFNQNYNQRLTNLNDAMPGVRTMLVLDAEGISRLSNKPELIGKDFKEREYFKTPQYHANSDTLYVSPPFKTALNTYVINISRYIRGADGVFAGVIAASLDPDYFSTLLSSVQYAPDMWTYLSHGDGKLFLMIPHREGISGKDLSTPDSMLSRHLATKKEANVFTGQVMATGEQRMIALRTIQPPNLKMHKPLVVAASRDLVAIYATWKTSTFVHTGLFLLFVIISSLMLYLYQKRFLEAERQKAEADKNIKALSEELDRFFSMALDMLCIADSEGHFRRLNRSWEEVLGYPLDELTGQRFLDFVHPEDIPATLAAMADLDHDKPIMNFVNRYRCKDGSYRWIEWRSTPYMNQVYAAARDITDRKNAEAALRTALTEAERFREALDHVSSYIYMKDRDHRYVYANKPTLELFGVTADELIGCEDSRFFPPATVTRLREVDTRVFSGEQTSVEIDVTDAPGGRRVYWEVKTPIYEDPDRSAIWGLCGISTDITELKNTEAALEQSERFMRMLTDIIPGMVGYWDKELRNGFANIAYLEWFGKTPEEMRGIHIRDLMGDELFSKNEPFITAALRGERQQFERTLTKADGSTGHTWAHYIPDIDGEDVRGFFVLVSDVTELKQAQIKLETLNEELRKRTLEAESANRAKSEFLANMSHEIRTPMNAILGLTRIVLDTELTSRQADYLRKVHGSSQALMVILNDILDYSKIEAGRLEIENLPICVADILDDTAELFSARLEEKGLAMLLDIDPHLPEVVMGDPLRISQVLNNLVGNAVKFTETGEIHIKVETAAEDSRSITLRFAVRDTGIGLSKAQSDRLFQAFTQADGTISRKYGGTGLGLTISQRLVRLMGGDINVSSIEGAGATFTFAIQVQKAPPGTLAARQRRKKPDAGIATVHKPAPAIAATGAGLLGARILLVEDNRINQEVAGEFLRQQGATVTMAEHGAEALALIQRPCFDAVLMDLHMPVMDGFEATRKIREFFGNNDLPIIAMTAAVMQDDRERCSAAGMVDFVAKPINPDELTAILKKWLKISETAHVIPDEVTICTKATQPLESMSGFDIAAALRRMNGNENLLRSLLLQFVQEHANAAEELKALLSEGKTYEAQHLAHTIKGAAGTVGAVRLAEAASALEQELRTGVDPSDVDHFGEELSAANLTIRSHVPDEAKPTVSNILFSETDSVELIPLLAELTHFLHEQELAPEELMQRLHTVADKAGAPEPATALKLLLRQLDCFDHAAALETVERLMAKQTTS